MNRALFAAAAACILLLAGCLGQTPFRPSAVRFGGVDSLESREAPRAPIDIRLDRDAFAGDDALVARVLLDATLVGKDRPAKLSVIDADGRAAATLDLADVRNTELIIHVQFRQAPPGKYALRVEIGGKSAEKAFSVGR